MIYFKNFHNLNYILKIIDCDNSQEYIYQITMFLLNFASRNHLNHFFNYCNLILTDFYSCENDHYNLIKLKDIIFNNFLLKSSSISIHKLAYNFILVYNKLNDIHNLLLIIIIFSFSSSLMMFQKINEFFANKNLKPYLRIFQINNPLDFDKNQSIQFLASEFNSLFTSSIHLYIKNDILYIIFYLHNSYQIFNIYNLTITINSIVFPISSTFEIGRFTSFYFKLSLHELYNRFNSVQSDLFDISNNNTDDINFNKSIYTNIDDNDNIYKLKLVKAININNKQNNLKTLTRDIKFISIGDIIHINSSEKEIDTTIISKNNGTVPLYIKVSEISTYLDQDNLIKIIFNKGTCNDYNFCNNIWELNLFDFDNIGSFEIKIHNQTYNILNLNQIYLPLNETLPIVFSLNSISPYIIPINLNLIYESPIFFYQNQIVKSLSLPFINNSLLIELIYTKELISSKLKLSFNFKYHNFDNLFNLTHYFNLIYNFPIEFQYKLIKNVDDFDMFLKFSNKSPYIYTLRYPSINETIKNFTLQPSQTYHDIFPISEFFDCLSIEYINNNVLDVILKHTYPLTLNFPMTDNIIIKSHLPVIVKLFQVFTVSFEIINNMESHCSCFIKIEDSFELYFSGHCRLDLLLLPKDSIIIDYNFICICTGMFDVPISEIFLNDDSNNITINLAKSERSQILCHL